MTHEAMEASAARPERDAFVEYLQTLEFGGPMWLVIGDRIEDYRRYAAAARLQGRGLAEYEAKIVLTIVRETQRIRQNDPATGLAYRAAEVTFQERFGYYSSLSREVNEEAYASGRRRLDQTDMSYSYEVLAEALDEAMQAETNRRLEEYTRGVADSAR